MAAIVPPVWPPLWPTTPRGGRGLQEEPIREIYEGAASPGGPRDFAAHQAKHVITNADVEKYPDVLTALSVNHLEDLDLAKTDRPFPHNAPVQRIWIDPDGTEIIKFRAAVRPRPVVRPGVQVTVTLPERHPEVGRAGGRRQQAYVVLDATDEDQAVCLRVARVPPPRRQRRHGGGETDLSKAVAQYAVERQKWVNHQDGAPRGRNLWMRVYRNRPSPLDTEVRIKTDDEMRHDPNYKAQTERRRPPNYIRPLGADGKPSSHLSDADSFKKNIRGAKKKKAFQPGDTRFVGAAALNALRAAFYPKGIDHTVFEVMPYEGSSTESADSRILDEFTLALMTPQATAPINYFDTKEKEAAAFGLFCDTASHWAGVAESWKASNVCVISHDAYLLGHLATIAEKYGQSKDRPYAKKVFLIYAPDGDPVKTVGRPYAPPEAAVLYKAAVEGYEGELWDADRAGSDRKLVGPYEFDGKEWHTLPIMAEDEVERKDAVEEVKHKAHEFSDELAKANKLIAKYDASPGGWTFNILVPMTSKGKIDRTKIPYSTANFPAAETMEHANPDGAIYQRVFPATEVPARDNGIVAGLAAKMKDEASYAEDDQTLPRKRAYKPLVTDHINFAAFPDREHLIARDHVDLAFQPLANVRVATITADTIETPQENLLVLVDGDA